MKPPPDDSSKNHKAQHFEKTPLQPLQEICIAFPGRSKIVEPPVGIEPTTYRYPTGIRGDRFWRVETPCQLSYGGSVKILPLNKKVFRCSSSHRRSSSPA
jgi:hypothetical protein